MGQPRDAHGFALEPRVRELAAQSDVVLENYKVGQLKKYGLDYESLKEINPELIYCSITGFGQTGPYATRAGYDFMIQGLGGLMSLTGRPEGEDGAGPVKVGVALTDIAGNTSVILVTVLAVPPMRSAQCEASSVEDTA